MYTFFISGYNITNRYSEVTKILESKLQYFIKPSYFLKIVYNILKIIYYKKLLEYKKTFLEQKNTIPKKLKNNSQIIELKITLK